MGSDQSLSLCNACVAMRVDREAHVVCMQVPLQKGFAFDLTRCSFVVAVFLCLSVRSNGMQVVGD